MNSLHTARRAALTLLALAVGQACAATNLIDQTYGAGAGSFELGVFVPRGTSLSNFQSLLAGSATLVGWQIGWQIGGVGVDWLAAPEPATWALGALGGGLLLARRRAVRPR